MRLVTVFITIICVFDFLSSQVVDSLQVTLPDTSKIDTVMAVDSLAVDTLLNVEKEDVSDLVYRRLWQQFQLEDGLKDSVYGLADIFRHNADFQIYDFFSFGYPRFVAGNNLLPHQSGINLNGHVLNDPINGMFNTHMISLDGLAEVNNNAGISIYGYNKGINLKTRALISEEEPYSRVMFRQGDFGYTDLDISFSRRFSDNISANLGGINKIYQSQGNHGFQYRGGLYVKLNDRIFSKTIFNIDRERIINTNLSAFPSYRYHEFRHDYYSSIYYITDPGQHERWKLDAGYTRIRGSNEVRGDSAAAFFSRRRADQYSLSLNRNILLNSIRINASAVGYQSRIWGGSFNDKLIDSGVNGSIEINYPVLDRINMYGSLKAGYLYDNDLNWSPAAGARFDFNPLILSFHGSSLKRFPYRNERSINFNQYQGNRNLDSETLNSVSIALEYRPFNNLNVNTKFAANQVRDEILFDGSSFYNGPDRTFSYANLHAGYSLYMFSLEIGGQLSDAGVNLSPKRSFSGQLRYHDKWINDAIIIDAVGNFHWYDTHNSIYYNPVVQRFYWSDTETDGYYYFSYKITATVKSAQLYVAMDNPMSYDYQYISGYYELYRRVRFGVNWILFD